MNNHASRRRLHVSSVSSAISIDSTEGPLRLTPSVTTQPVQINERGMHERLNLPEW